MGFPALTKKGTPDNHSSPKVRPNHFPITPFLKPPPSDPTTQSTVDNRFSRVTTESGASAHSTWRKDPFARRLDSQTTTSIYESFNRPSMDNKGASKEPVVEIDDKSNRRHRTTDLLSPVPSDRHRIPSRCSSLDGLSNPPSIYSPASTTTDLTDIPGLNLRLHRTPHDGGYESSSSAHHGGRRHRSNVRAQMMNAEVLEEHADEDKVSAHHLNTIRGRNQSLKSVASKVKADKLLGMAAPTTSLVSAYVCSGLGLVSNRGAVLVRVYAHHVSFQKRGLWLTPMRSEVYSHLKTQWECFGDQKSFITLTRATPWPNSSPLVSKPTGHLS